MKLVFNKLETPASEIKVAFDGVNYKSYNVDEIKSTGYIQFTEDECPDLTKVKIQGKFSTLGSVEVNKAVELERGEGGAGISCTFEKDIIEEVKTTTTYYCFLFDGNGDGQITEDDKSDFSWAPKFWVEGELSENAKLYRCYEDAPNSINDLELCSGPNEKLWFPNSGYNDYNVLAGSYDPDYPSDDGGERWLRYPEGDLTQTKIEKVKVGTETVTEVITEIQDEPTITENGQTIADEGKAFKSVRIHGIVSSISKFSSVSSDFLKEHFDDEYIDTYGSIENGTVLKPINLLISNDDFVWRNGVIALFVPLEVGDVISDKIESWSGYQTSGELRPRVFDYANNILHCFMTYPM